MRRWSASVRPFIGAASDHLMEVLAVTIFLSLCLAGFFVVMLHLWFVQRLSR